MEVAGALMTSYTFVICFTLCFFTAGELASLQWIIGGATAMKINDKHLVAFATGSAPVDKQGYMLKRGDVNKSFQKRWFVLKGNLLFYFERKGDREPIGVIVLEGCTVELAENVDAFSFELVFPGSGCRTYVFATDTQEAMEDWMKTITCAGYEFMKLMVAELQRHLDELNMSSCSNTSPADVRASAIPSDPWSAAPTQTDKLVDVAASGDDTKNRRYNPFNATDGAVDLFGAQPFCAEPTASNTSRTFEELHAEYGRYIEEKMREHSLAAKQHVT